MTAPGHHGKNWSGRFPFCRPRSGRGAALLGIGPGRLRAFQRYLSVLLVGNLVWEMLQMPLYTLWTGSTWGEILFAAFHCTGGDLLIGAGALLLSLLTSGRHGWPNRRFVKVASLAVAAGILYTAFSEWLNVEVRHSWAYSALMPTVPIGSFRLGLSPMMQWLAVPTLAFAAVWAGNGDAPTAPTSVDGSAALKTDVARASAERPR